MAPRVAVVVPVHNVETYLPACLDSICRQSLSDIEIVCVDDASTDASPQILADYAKRDSRIKIIRQAVNHGLSVARNTGLAQVTAPWVVFVDSDDVVSRNLCEHCLRESERAGADVVFFDYTSFEDGGAVPVEPDPASAVPAVRAQLLLRQSFAWTKFTSTELLRERGIEYPAGLCLQDVPVHWRLVLEARNPVFLAEALVWYRQRASSISYRADWTRADGFLVYDMVRDYLKATGRWDQWSHLFIVKELNIFADIYLNFSGRNGSLARRANAEARLRMTKLHWEAALSGDGIPTVKRDYLLAACRPENCAASLAQMIPTARHAFRGLLRGPWRLLRRVMRPTAKVR